MGLETHPNMTSSSAMTVNGSLFNVARFVYFLFGLGSWGSGGPIRD
jgi:hypothetical protein